MISSKASIRHILAAMFVLLLLAEFGSHGLICSGETGGQGQSVIASQHGHEDPCSTLIQCGYDQNQRQAPTLGHDAMQHNGLIDGIFELSCNVWLRVEPPISPDVDDPLFRPKEPPFHPPKST